MLLSSALSGLLQASARRCMIGASVSLARFATQASHTFYHKDLEVVGRPCTSKPELPEELSFGKTFTPHMLKVEHTDAEGWGTPQILPFGPVSLHPASQVLHYGACCFEGMKAYLGVDNKGRMFRPDMNMARLARSASRLMLAGFDPKELQKCIEVLLRVDRAWFPTKPGHSIYIRPFMFASDNSLGVHRTTATTLMVILSPVGPYFKTGAQPVGLYMDTHNVRAWPGGAGAYKIGGNYAPTVLPQVQAAKQYGCSQVMYTLPNGPNPDDALLSECGAMNLFFLLRHDESSSSSSSSSTSSGSSSSSGLELVTPALDGTILPGVTRDSILQLANRRKGLQVSERGITIGEIKAAHREGRLVEVFGAGTACVVQPVGTIVTSCGSRLEVPMPKDVEGEEATLWGQLQRDLMDIQYGRKPHDWSVPFE